MFTYAPYQYDPHPYIGIFFMDQIQTFNFHANKVRTATDRNGDIYFCLTDVANVLELGNTNAGRFQLDEKGVHKMYTPTNGGTQELTFISEPNLYRVIFRSNKEQAKQFQDWVFSEVLPQIRRTGVYEVQAPTPTDPLLLIAHLAQSAYEIQQKQVEMDNRLIKVEQTQQRLDQDNNHYTIKGFCSLHNIDLSNGKMSALSRKAKKLSEVKEYTYHEISDPRFGKVKCYHIDILTELFQMQNLL